MMYWEGDEGSELRKGEHKTNGGRVTRLKEGEIEAYEKKEKKKTRKKRMKRKKSEREKTSIELKKKRRQRLIFR